jgi:hypothetical protein
MTQTAETFSSRAVHAPTTARANAARIVAELTEKATRQGLGRLEAARLSNARFALTK